MALTSRLGFCLGLLSLGLAACSRSSGDARHAEAFFQDPVRRPDHDAVLVLMPDTEHTRAVLLGIRDEVGDELDVLVRPVDRDLSAEEIEAMLAELQPRCVVLMDNPTVKAYRELQLARPSVTFPPAVVVMASFLEEHYRLVKNATGIAYEVPALTLFTHLRTILVSPVEKVGVVYRPAFRGYIDRQRELAKREAIELIGVAVPQHPSVRDVRRALETLRTERGAHALWVLNDNGLLTPELIQRAWMPLNETGRRVPLVVGAASLVSAKFDFGTFAMLPDHGALGMQVGALIFKLADDDWTITRPEIQPPLSTKTVINLRQAERDFKLAPTALSQVDRIVN
ncbi:MAG: hypothetical protein GX607_01330 [Myxococcales bacterium]|jgi:hypothetical protein|nr:hypothetical protein [Myxococcales bacterium]